MQAVFRRLTEADVALALEMNERFREGLIDGACARRFLENPDHWLYAALMDGHIVGFAYGYALSRLDRDGKMLYIHEVGVMEGMQRRGVGFAMLCALKEECAKRQIFRCFLFTSRHNAGANALYRKLGGEKSRESQGEDCCYFFQIDPCK